jgi:hypothetical protein
MTSPNLLAVGLHTLYDNYFVNINNPPKINTINGESGLASIPSPTYDVGKPSDYVKPANKLQVQPPL